MSTERGNHFEARDFTERVINTPACYDAEVKNLAVAYEEAHECIRQLEAVVKDFLPNIGKCVLRDYKRLNESLLEATRILGK